MLMKFLYKRYQSKDWIGVWYNILKSRGENDLIAMTRTSITDAGEITNLEKISFSHAIMDGTSAIPYYMKQFGQKEAEPRSMSHLKKFSLFEVAKLTYKTLKVSPANNSQWINFSNDKIEDIFAYSKIVMSIEETTNFLKYCKDTKTSENAILLELVSDLIFPLLKNQDEYNTWLFPVNVRGMVQKNNNYANHTSFVPVDVKLGTKAREIHEDIKNELKSFKYLGRWWVHHISMIAPLSYLKKLSLKASQTKFWLGSFSNVGQWQTQDGYKPLGTIEDESWFFATPGSRNFPISCVVMTMNGRMSFALRLHPAICKQGQSLHISDDILNHLRIRINQLYS